MAQPTAETTKRLRELSYVLSGQTANQVAQILRRNLHDLEREKDKLAKDYKALVNPRKKDTEDFNRRNKNLNTTIEQLSQFRYMFEDISWSMSVQSEPAFFRRMCR